ncbi:MAG: DHA2 family efflux MFS transporter permease subunit [Thermoleophilaceae bacterium]|nr:DHA2 family efflux MFS transporter permease subunit [Thermoleophilaceae bacterium]
MAKQLPPDVRRIAIVVIVGAVMSILDTTIVNVALQTLRDDLGTSLSTIQWVSTGYLLALATAIPLTGWAAERFGPRRVWMSVVTAFVATSALCGLAWSAESLIAFRVLQGFAGGMIMPIGMITLAQAAGPERMGRVMSVVGVPMLLAPVLGPVIGGAIVESLSWRWIFFVNLPVGIVGLLLARRLLPHGRAEGRAAAAGEPTSKLDWRGLALVSPGVAAIVFGISEYGDHRTLATPLAWVPLVLGTLAVAAFVVHALHARYPLVDVGLFRSAGFSAAAGTVFLTGVALFGSMILLPLYYQLARGESPLVAGLLLAPQGLGAALGMNLGGRATDRFGGGRVVIVGLLLLLLGTAVFTRLGPDTSYWLIGAALVVRGLGLAGSMMPAMAAAYATLQRSEVPRATPALNVLQRVGGAIGAALLIVIVQNRIVAGTPPAEAFAHAFTYALVLTGVALIPALLLARAEARTRRAARAATAPAAMAPT